MNGCIIEGTPIAVDFWQPTKAPQVRLFFLTHLHADHTKGLSSSWRLPIYTSPINALLLTHKFKLPKSIINELEVGETYLIPLDQDQTTVSVTPLDANHVPGGVMYLFQGYFGNILYCGDMRWYPELLDHPLLNSVVSERELDIVYLDNTFSAPYCKFPSREEAQNQLLELIDTYPDHVFKISIRDLGREDLLEAVAIKFQERILVNQSKYEILEILQYSDVFTTNPKHARIHAVPMQQVQIKSHRNWNEESPTITVMLTALFEGWPGGPYSSQAAKGLFRIPYSDHSSFDELQDMVACLKPRKLIPIVKSISKGGWWSDPQCPDQTVKLDMSLYDHLLTYPPPLPFEIPATVSKLMQPGGPLLSPNRLRKCSQRRGPLPRPRSLMRKRGIVYTTPERSPFSPAPSSSITLDVSMSLPTSSTTIRPDVLKQSPHQVSIRSGPSTPTTVRTETLQGGLYKRLRARAAQDLKAKRKLDLDKATIEISQNDKIQCALKSTKIASTSLGKALESGSTSEIIDEGKQLNRVLRHLIKSYDIN